MVAALGHILTRCSRIPEAERKALKAIEEAMDAGDSHAAKERYKRYKQGLIGQQTYEVTEREERPDTVLIRLDCVGEAVGK